MNLPCLLIVRVPEGLEDVSTFPKLIEELLRRGYSDEEASKVAGGNLITAMEKMEKVSKGQLTNDESFISLYDISSLPSGKVIRTKIFIN